MVYGLVSESVFSQVANKRLECHLRGWEQFQCCLGAEGEASFLAGLFGTVLLVSDLVDNRCLKLVDVQSRWHGDTTLCSSR